MNQIRQTKAFNKIFAVLSIFNLIFTIGTIGFFAILLANNGIMHYLFIFGISGLIFLILTIICFCAWMYMTETYKVTNKIIDRINEIEANGIKLDIQEVESQDTPQEINEVKEEPIIQENWNELNDSMEYKQESKVPEEKPFKTERVNHKEEDLSFFAAQMNQNEESAFQEEIIQKEVETFNEPHKEVVQEVKTTEDTFKNFYDFEYDENIFQDVFINVGETNVKKREQSKKNCEVLKDIQRVIEFKDCVINANFINCKEYTLNVDYLEDIKIENTSLKFMLFDINYLLHFEYEDELNNFIAYLGYLKHKKK